MKRNNKSDISASAGRGWRLGKPRRLVFAVSERTGGIAKIYFVCTNAAISLSGGNTKRVDIQIGYKLAYKARMWFQYNIEIIE